VYPFWDTVIQPILFAVGARTIVEVGAESGRSTVLIMRLVVACRGTLHVVEPEPRFDVGECERVYGKRFVLHRARSLDALPNIKEPDAILLDGDHNWYTVIEELRVLQGSGARHWPLTFLHDVDWPYGRRDMYYDPEKVPAEFRHPFARSGMVKHVSELSPSGANPEYANATHEGGPRNGVLTAIEDFVDESDHELELFLFPGPAGLALLIDHARLEQVSPIVRRVADQAFARTLSPGHASRIFDQ
jgi:methyltransferase family protein